MSSVFISNVDDYLAPSQACVNPMFADSINNNENKQEEKKHDAPTDAAAAVVVPRKRRIVRKRPSSPLSTEAPVIPSTPAKVTMADCLACSGCVTTAETVLVEQHSLSTLKQALLDTKNEHFVFTMSPASYGDLVRKLGTDPSLSLKRKLTTFLHEKCRASIVLDGRVSLEWSLQEAAMEFCQAFQQRNSQETYIPPPSFALSNTQIQYMDGRVVDCTYQSNSRIPLLTSSCPALVCLVEKSTPAAVPHLSTTKSPMSIAGAYYASLNKNTFHVAIMPCHDKKLEASRKDLSSENGKPDVDLVITTQELWTLLCETAQSDDKTDVLQYMESLEQSPVWTDVAGLAATHDATSNAGMLVVPQSNGSDDKDVEMMDMTTTTTDDSLQQSHDFFAYGSGGYADYIFRFASRHVFGHVIPSNESLPWTPVETATTRRVVSARVAASAKRRRDYHQVTLYQHLDGSFSCFHESPQDTPVLRFATAYGLQNIQRVLQYAPFSTSAASASPLPFDYVEAMACPSGCPNGGGQIRQAADVRETPTETRERVFQTNEIMKHDTTTCDTVEYPTDQCPSGPFGEEAKRLFHTRFHVVPPLQHTMGAAAGVAVQDTQW